MRKKLKNESHGPNWLDTYADMITLVLTFFVLLFAMSNVDKDKWEMLVKALRGEGDAQQQVVIVDGSRVEGEGLYDPTGPGDVLDLTQQSGVEITQAEDVVTYEDLYKYLKKYIADNHLESDVELVKGDGYTFITFRNDIFFDGDSARLRAEGKKVLDVICDAFINIADDIGQIRVQGHTARFGAANQPNDSLFNWQLSSDRAAQVTWYIDSKNILEKEKLSCIGYADTMPIVPHDGTEATRAKNRRVELYIEKAGEGAKQLSEIYDELAALKDGS